MIAPVLPESVRGRRRVLFVCLGNICRSPLAQGVFEHLASARGVRSQFTIESCGIGGWHAGEEMSPPAAREVRRRGGDTRGFAASKLRGDLLDSADLVLTATAEQQYYVLGLRAQIAPRTFVLGEFGRLLGNVDPSALPPYEPTADAVFARGTALVPETASRSTVELNRRVNKSPRLPAGGVSSSILRGKPGVPARNRDRAFCSPWRLLRA